MRTIFITSFNPFIGRNILSTDVLGVLRGERDLRIVIMVPDYKAEYFKKTFDPPSHGFGEASGSNVIFEGVRSQVISRQDVLFRDLANSLADTSTLRFHRRRRRAQGGSFFRYAPSAFISRVLSRFVAVKRIARFFDQLTISKTKFARFFEKYQPSLVFATDVFHDDDVHFLAEAKQRGIKTIGMIRSWDNITNKGMFRMRPDKLIAHNEVIKEEAVRYCDIRPEDVVVSGMPQFDEYVNVKPASKQGRPLILVAPHGRRFYEFDRQLLQLLDDAQRGSDLPPEVQWLVRFPPNDTVDLAGFSLPPHFAVQHPGREFTPGRYNDREVTAEDTKTLRDALARSALVIHYGSTIGIDAAFFDVPNIIVFFDSGEAPDYLKSARRFEEYEHLRKLIALGGSRVVRSRRELIAAIKEYLAYPEHDREGRARVVQAQCAYTDGKSGQRIAQLLLKQLSSTNNESVTNKRM